MKNNYSYAGVAFIILIFGIWGANELGNRNEKRDLITFEKVPSFEFINQNGNTISNKDYEGKVYVVEFFFTTCPTICPIMTQNTVLLQNKFYGNPHFGIASISINPKHDTPIVMKSYAKDKGATMENWNFLTGDEATIFKFSNEGFKLYAGVNDEVEGGFEHSGLFALVDKNGFIRSRTVKMGTMKTRLNFMTV